VAWSKVKNIIIVILAALNLCLLALIVSRQMQSRRYAGETLIRTIEVLENNGLAVETAGLPSEDQLPSMSVSRNDEKEKAAAEFLLGQEVISSYSGGMSIHSSVKGNLSFYGGSMAGSFAIPWSEFDSFRAHAESLLQGMEIDVWKLESVGETVTAVPALNGVPVFNARIEFTYEGDLLKRIEGRFPGSVTPEKEQEVPITIPTALISLLEYVMESGTVCRSVRNVTPGYFIASTGADSARITQCWHVETDTVPFYIDAATGNVTRAD